MGRPIRHRLGRLGLQPMEHFRLRRRRQQELSRLDILDKNFLNSRLIRQHQSLVDQLILLPLRRRRRHLRYKTKLTVRRSLQGFLVEVLQEVRFLHLYYFLPALRRQILSHRRRYFQLRRPQKLLSQK